MTGLEPLCWTRRAEEAGQAERALQPFRMGTHAHREEGLSLQRERKGWGQTQTEGSLARGRRGGDKWPQILQATQLPHPQARPAGRRRPHSVALPDDSRRRAGPSVTPTRRTPRWGTTHGAQPHGTHRPRFCFPGETDAPEPSSSWGAVGRGQSTLPPALVSSTISSGPAKGKQERPGGRMAGGWVVQTRPRTVRCLASGHFCPLLGRGTAGKGRAVLPSPVLPVWDLSGGLAPSPVPRTIPERPW